MEVKPEIKMQELPKTPSERIVGETYLLPNGDIRIWNKYGRFFCIHGRQVSRCRDCGGSSFCIHNKERKICALCGGSQICEHNIERAKCKHCGGSQICVHGRVNYDCKECDGVAICKHGIHKKNCAECDGNALCVHGISRTSCKQCGGSQICVHQIRKYDCMICEPDSAFIRTMRTRINSAIVGDAKSEDELIELLGCSISDARAYIEHQFSSEMNWRNHGRGDDNWHIDHRRPCASFNLNNYEEMRMCFHYSNLQPLMQGDNLRKLAKFDESTFQWYWNGDKWIEIETID